MLLYYASPTRPPSGSDIVHADVMGAHVIILNSIKAGHELLDKRSTIYSDRYGPRHRRKAPLFHPLIQLVSQTVICGSAKAVRQTGLIVPAF